MNNRVVHFEIPSDDPEKSIAFFKEAFGWSFQQFGSEPYWIALTGAETVPGINGAIMKKRDPMQPLVNSISVENMDESIDKITGAGGQIVVPKMALPGVGWMAYFKDPDGNIHGIWQLDNTAQ